MLYATNEGIRASLGVDASEVSDAALAAMGLDTLIQVDLNAWLPTHAQIYATGTAQGATPTQVLQKDLLVACAQWYAAAVVAGISPFFLTTSQDGDDRVARSAVNGETLRQYCLGFYTLLRDQLLTATGSQASNGTFVLFSVSQPGYDPITGSGY